jgi:hypothetical protein
LLLPCGFHLLPERVIFSLNLVINKYFGRDAHLQHRITINHDFFHEKTTASGQESISREIHHEMRNCSEYAPIYQTRSILANYISQNYLIRHAGERIFRTEKNTNFAEVPA